MEGLQRLLDLGGTKKDIVLLALSGIGLALSLLGLPLPFDPAWAAIVLCGVPIVLEAVVGLVTAFDIKADVLVSLALIASVCIGEDFAAGEVAFIMQLGGLLEDLTVARARAGIERLVKLTPRTARIVREGGEEVVPAERVQAGNVLRVLPGETVPVDGAILTGQTSVDQSVMTGESLPVDKGPGDEVSSGTVNQFGAFDLVAAKVGEDSSIQRMIRLVEDILRLSQLDEGAESLEREPVELLALSQEVARRLEPAARSAGVSVEVWGAPVQVQGVRRVLDEMIYNLCENAIKYNRTGGRVTLTVGQGAEGPEVTVADTGIGIPAKEQKKLFKLHFRGSNAINAKITGSGIGLMLVWKLVRIHKGKISIESVENKGTRVKVIFPQKQFRNQQVPTETVQQENVAPVSPSAVSPHTYKDLYRQHVQNTQRILVVEDNDDLREYLFHTLSEAYQVETCTNGKEALKIIPEFKPDLVLSDIMMPEMRGDELCSAIKNNILTSHIPVILLTALNDEKNIVEGLETGADKYLIKPFNIGILKASIANILTNRALLRRKYADMELHNDSISINYSNTLDQQFLEAVKETITENLDNSSFNVESLCASQNMSRSSFYNKLKALTDQAPADYIRLIRLKRAAQLLSEGQYNISEISDMTGFNDVKYFREVFKKYYKISPSGYSKGEMKEEPAKP